MSFTSKSSQWQLRNGGSTSLTSVTLDSNSAQDCNGAAQGSAIYSADTPTLEKVAQALRGLSLLSRMSGAETALMSESYAEVYLPLNQFGWSALYAWRDDRYKFVEAR